MLQVQLSKSVWQFDESQPLGPPGGFGAVFLGVGTNNSKVAVKRLHLKTRQHSSRELEIAEYLLGHEHPHVIPILDVGADVGSGHYFIVMAYADQSLEDLVNKAAPIAEHDALEIIDAIVAGLEEIKDLVHRDLKPGNVLLHNGVWKLADLGLARFVEESTSPNTMKGFLSAPYAAPEQWRLERATKATDIYALGCIIYSLITGKPPFSGSTQEDYSHQHQVVAPPNLPASARLRQIALSCLAKNPQVRPSIQSLRAQIQRARMAAGTATSNPLASVAADIAELEVNEEANNVLQSKVAEDRRAMAKEAIENVKRILEGLFEQIKLEAPGAKQFVPATGQEKVALQLGYGELSYGILFPYLDKLILRNHPNWDVLAGATIKVGLGNRGVGIRGRSANLWFGKLASDEGYRWWEVSYTFTPETKGRDIFALQNDLPFAVYPRTDPWHNGIEAYSWYEIATNPRPIDGEYVEDFCARWMEWFAKAASNKVNHQNFFENVPEKEPIDPRFL